LSRIKKILKNPIFSYENLYIISPWGIRRDLNEDLSGWGRLNLRKNFNQKCRFSSQKRTNFNQKCRFSSQMGNFWDRMRTIFNQMRRGVKMGIRKRSKIFKNVQKLRRNIQKLTQNIRKYSNFLHPPAHLIDFSVGHEGTKTRRKIRRRLPKLTQIF
jgi:hypothetical protein